MDELEAAAVNHPVARSAIRKATWRLIPLIALGYGCAYMDRVNISFAALQMNQALHFTGTVYGFGAGLFFLSYALWEVPSNLMLYRFGARRWLARIMLTWGVIAMGMLFVRRPWQFYTARFFLGMAEAGFFPGVMFYLMQWFPPDLRARAISRFYISLPLSGVFMGAVAGALLNLNGHAHLAGWQWLFLVEGIPPILLSVAFLFLLPDKPADAPWLTAPEKEWFARSVDHTGDHIRHPAEPIHRILIDPRVWQIGIFGFLLLTSSYGYTLLLPQLVQASTHLRVSSIGFITAGINLLGVPAMLLGAKLSDRSPAKRHQHVMPWCLSMSAGLATAGFSNRPWIAIPRTLLRLHQLQCNAGRLARNYPRRFPWPFRSCGHCRRQHPLHPRRIRRPLLYGAAQRPHRRLPARTRPPQHPHAHQRRHHGLPRP